MDNKTIETLSVNAVKNSIVTSEFLDQFISENDKEPSWDGFVYIYGDKSKKKSNLKGRMPVQVKGTECDDHSKSKISFSMEVADLRNYLYDGGCILFVVYIGNAGITNKIYYIELTPLKLREILGEVKGQGSKTLYLEEFPTDNNKKATIFLNCLQNCQKQASFFEGDLLTVEELQQQGLLKNLVIPFSGVGIDDPQMAILSNEVYLYANVKGSSIPQPIKQLPKDSYTTQVFDANISIQDKIFYTSYSVIKKVNEVTIRFGKSFTMTYTGDNKAFKINYKNSNKIRDIAKDLDFILSYFDNGYFKVNDDTFPFDYTDMDTSNFDFEKEREHLEYAQKTVRVLDMFGCSEDIDVNDMNDEDWRNLNRLITAFIDKKPVTGLKEGLPIISCMKVGKLRFAIYLKACEDEMYEIYDFFKTDCSVAIDIGDGKKLPVSQFHILNKNDILSLNNINFDVLLPSFQKVEHHSETLNIANLFMLELLAAYDIAEQPKKDKILKVCEDFSAWVFEASDDELDYHTRILNKLQITRRRREFNIDEIRELYDIVENKEAREECIVAAYLLLGLQEAAELHFAKLNDDTKSNFKNFSIYHFWKEKEDEITDKLKHIE